MDQAVDHGLCECEAALELLYDRLNQLKTSP